jgi:predicted TIM-barrel fold metal-dependent hydrolase
MTVLGVSHTTPDFSVPDGACDCHLHLFAPQDRHPLDEGRLYTPGPATVPDLLARQTALSLSRAVIVQASPQGVDNRFVIECLGELGARARGVAVIDEGFSLARLRAMDAAGVRGIRINLESHGSRDPEAARGVIAAAAARVAPLGWHVQTYCNATTLAALADTIATLPTPLVADHFACLRAADGLDGAAAPTVLGLVAAGQHRVKLSAPHRAAADPEDVGPLARALYAANPAMMLWGSDWPHPTLPPRGTLDLSRIDPFRPVDDGAALNRLARWFPEAEARRRILVDNPAALYGF